MAPEVEKHPLLVLFLNLLRVKDVSLRILGFRELEKCLANNSEIALGPLRSVIDRLSVQYAELCQSKSGQNERLEQVSKLLQQSREEHNTAVVSPEHLWRELSHLYVAVPSMYSKFTQSIM